MLVASQSVHANRHCCMLLAWLICPVASAGFGSVPIYHPSIDTFALYVSNGMPVLPCIHSVCFSVPNCGHCQVEVGILAPFSIVPHQRSETFQGITLRQPVLHDQGAQRDVASTVEQRGPLHSAACHQQVEICCGRRQTPATCNHPDTAACCSPADVAGFLQLERCLQATQLLFSGPQQSTDQVPTTLSLCQILLAYSS